MKDPPRTVPRAGATEMERNRNGLKGLAQHPVEAVWLKSNSSVLELLRQLDHSPLNAAYHSSVRIRVMTMVLVNFLLSSSSPPPLSPSLQVSTTWTMSRGLTPLSTLGRSALLALLLEGTFFPEHSSHGWKIRSTRLAVNSELYFT